MRPITRARVMARVRAGLGLERRRSRRTCEWRLENQLGVPEIGCALSGGLGRSSTWSGLGLRLGLGLALALGLGPGLGSGLGLGLGLGLGSR